MPHKVHIDFRPAATGIRALTAEMRVTESFLSGVLLGEAFQGVNRILEGGLFYEYSAVKNKLAVLGTGKHYRAVLAKPFRAELRALRALNRDLRGVFKIHGGLLDRASSQVAGQLGSCAPEQPRQQGAANGN